MRIDPIKKLIEMVEHTRFDDVKKIAHIAAINYESYKDSDFFSGVTLYVFDVVDGLITLQNGTHTRYSDAVEADVEKLTRLIYDSTFTEHQLELIDQIQKERDFKPDESAALIEVVKLKTYADVKSAVLDHYRTEFRGNDDYVPLEKMPVIEWAMQEGSLKGRLDLFKNIYFFSLKTNTTRH